MRSTRHCLVPILAIAASAVFLMLAADAPTSTSSRPRYTPEGLLEVPTGFRSWVFVGADLSPVYKGEGPATSDSFHNVYINPESYKAFLETGQFPDPTMLVMEVFKAVEQPPGGIVEHGKFEKQRVAFEVAVKDSEHPHEGVPWSYYSFPLDEKSKPFKPAEANAKKTCYDCHLQHASKDNVWVQFYPALNDPM